MGRDSKRESGGGGGGGGGGVWRCGVERRERFVGRFGGQRGPFVGGHDGRSRSRTPAMRELLLRPGLMKPIAAAAAVDCVSVGRKAKRVSAAGHRSTSRQPMTSTAIIWRMDNISSNI